MGPSRECLHSQYGSTGLVACSVFPNIVTGTLSSRRPLRFLPAFWGQEITYASVVTSFLEVAFVSLPLLKAASLLGKVMGQGRFPSGLAVKNLPDPGGAFETLLPGKLGDEAPLHFSSFLRSVPSPTLFSPVPTGKSQIGHT